MSTYKIIRTYKYTTEEIVEAPTKAEASELSNPEDEIRNEDDMLWDENIRLL